MSEFIRSCADSLHVLDRALMCATLIATVSCLLYRRRTLRYRWERGTTLTALLGGIGLCLTSPQLIILNPLIDDAVFDPAVDWPAQIVWGNSFIIAGLVTFAYDLAGRMDWTPREMQYWIATRVTIPATFFTPSLIAGYWMDMSLVVKTALVGGYIWIGIDLVWLLWLIRRTDARSGHIVNLYLATYVLALVSVFACFFLPGNSVSSMWSWRLGCVCLLLFMFTASLSWLHKQRWMKAHMWKRVGRDKLLKRKGIEPKQLDGAY